MDLFDFTSDGYDEEASEQTLSSWYHTIRKMRDNGLIDENRVNLQGIIGAPPIFSEYADAKSSVNKYGKQYIKRFIEDGNFVAIEAGKPLLKMDKNEVVDSTVSDGEGESVKEMGKRLLNVMQDVKGQLFGFQTAMDEYWSDVQQIASMSAWMFGLDDNGILDELGFGDLDNFHWGDFRSDYIKDYTDGVPGSGRWNIVPFYNDGIIETGESISHTVGPTSLENNINNNVVTNNSISNTFKEVAMLTGMDVKESLEEAGKYSENDPIQDTTLGAKIGNMFTGGMAAMNIKMDLPDIWQDTQYSKDYNLKFKLTTPHGDPLSIWLNILVPLAHIIPLVSARTIGVTNTYLGGYLLRVYSEGMVNLTMGMATNVTIERNQKAVTAEGLPTEIDVTVTIKDLQPLFALPVDSTFGAYAKTTGIMGYLGTLCGYNTAYIPMEDRLDLAWDATKNKAANWTPRGISNNIRNKGKAMSDRMGAKFSNSLPIP